MEKSKDYALIISVLSIIIALGCVGVVVFHNFDQNGVVELGTFIGIGVALIGICATLIVGLQILNYIEFKDIKNRIQQIDTLESTIKNVINSHDTALSNSNEQLANVFVTLAKKEGVYPMRIDLLVSSIVIQLYGVSRYDTTNFSLSLHHKYVQLQNDVNVFDNMKMPEPISWERFKTINFPITIENRDKLQLMHCEIMTRISAAIKRNNNE